MLRKMRIGVAVVTAFMMTSAAAMAAVVHTDNFFNGSNTSDYRSVGSFSVSVNSATARNASISFELFGARSVDGVNDWQDNYSFALNGTTLFEASFDLGGGGVNTVFTNPNSFSSTPISFGFFQGGMATVSGFVDLIVGQNQLTFSFTSPGPANGGGQSIDDESWGVNNVEVSAVPVPASLPLLGAALCGLGMMVRRRAKRIA